MITRLPFLAWPRGQSRLTILFYHRVLAHPDPLRPGEFDAASFLAHMQMVSANLHALPLAEAVSRLRDDSLPERACCITFDDGYADNLTVAQPILERFDLPATVFVATGYLDGGRMFNDTLTEMVARFSGSDLDLRNFELGRHPTADVAQRRAAIAALLERAKRWTPEVREERIIAASKAMGTRDLPNDLMLTSAQLRELSRRGVEIGAHTVSHAILSTLNVEAARQEVAGGRARLEETLGRPVRLFAYPNGVPGRDYDAGHATLIRELGFDCAVSTARGVAMAGCDLYQLPRFQAWTGNPFKLATHLVRNARSGCDYAMA
ncbi:MAG: polysaccharide deacetylase family protein [Burkholderiales bacterium]